MSTDQHESSAARRYLFLALKISVSLVLLYVLFREIDVAGLWATVRRASIGWLFVALGVYGVNVLASTWRWHLLLDAQRVPVRRRSLFGSFMVALFFNNFLPSNIGGDVIRISDTAGPAQSTTRAAAVVLTDRVLGLMALVFVAALGASAAGAVHPAALPIWPVWLWVGFAAGAAASAPAVFAPAGFGRMLRPLTVFHPEWVGNRIEKLTDVLSRFRAQPSALAGCFLWAVFVQVSIVVFYFCVSWALHLGLAFSDLAVIVPLSFVVQMLPVSVNGFGVREATFSFYFTRVGHPLESALLISLVPQALIMLCSLGGAAIYMSRAHRGARSRPTAGSAAAI
jgi:glycosyltransferase 2 family protein